MKARCVTQSGFVMKPHLNRTKRHDADAVHIAIVFSQNESEVYRNRGRFGFYRDNFYLLQRKTKKNRIETSQFR